MSDITITVGSIGYLVQARDTWDFILEKFRIEAKANFLSEIKQANSYKIDMVSGQPIVDKVVLLPDLSSVPNTSVVTSITVGSMGGWDINYRENIVFSETIDPQKYTNTFLQDGGFKNPVRSFRDLIIEQTEYLLSFLPSDEADEIRQLLREAKTDEEAARLINALHSYIFQRVDEELDKHAIVTAPTAKSGSEIKIINRDYTIIDPYSKENVGRYFLDEDAVPPVLWFTTADGRVIKVRALTALEYASYLAIKSNNSNIVDYVLTADKQGNVQDIVFGAKKYDKSEGVAVQGVQQTMVTNILGYVAQSDFDHMRELVFAWDGNKENVLFAKLDAEIAKMPDSVLGLSTLQVKLAFQKHRAEAQTVHDWFARAKRNIQDEESKRDLGFERKRLPHAIELLLSFIPGVGELYALRDLLRYHDPLALLVLIPSAIRTARSIYSLLNKAEKEAIKVAEDSALFAPYREIDHLDDFSQAGIDVAERARQVQAAKDDILAAGATIVEATSQQDIQILDNLKASIAAIQRADGTRVVLVDPNSPIFRQIFESPRALREEFLHVLQMKTVDWGLARQQLTNEILRFRPDISLEEAKGQAGLIWSATVELDASEQLFEHAAEWGLTLKEKQSVLALMYVYASELKAATANYLRYQPSFPRP